MKYPLVVALLVLTIALGLGLGLGNGPKPANARWDWDWSTFKLADFNKDCRIDFIDMQSIGFRYGSFWGLSLYATKYDLNPYIFTGQYDWDIDIKDLQFVFGSNGMECDQFLDVPGLVGSYSYRGESSCSGSDNYVDPVTVVLTNIATTPHTRATSRLEEVLANIGLPVADHDGEQRFWEVTGHQCTYEDVDMAENDGGCFPTDWPPCPFVDVWERIHVRAEVVAESQWFWDWYAGQYHPFGGHVTWGSFAIGTPHFDDDDNTCGHFVAEEYPDWDDLCSSCTGSGFDAGREWMRQQLGTPARIEYWGNTRPIPQGCGDNQWPSSDGWIYYFAVD